MIDLTQVQALETLRLFTPFGIRFWDDVTGQVIGDGLSVIAYSIAYPARRVAAIVTPHGVYALHGLPGLHAVENGGPVTQRKPFVIEVVDSAGRFQPFLLQVEIPANGLFEWTCDPLSSPFTGGSSPATFPTFAPLFSSPTRLPPGGMAVVRAQLWDADANIPAAFAVVELFYGSKLLVRGFADAAGQVALIFAYPEPVAQYDTLGTSPPQLAGQGANVLLPWTLQIYANYQPSLPPSPAAGAIPDVCRVLSQSAATLWADSSRKQPLVNIQLTFGQACIVRSVNTGDDALLSTLLVTPAM